MRRCSIASVCVLLAGIAACGQSSSTPRAETGTSTSIASENRLGCSYEAAGAQLMPVADTDTTRWTTDQARKAIMSTSYFKAFDADKVRLWLARFSGTIPNPLTFENHLTEPTTLTNQLVWLAVVDDIPLIRHGGAPLGSDATGSTSSTRPLYGRAMAAFVDGVAPAQSVSGLSEGTEQAPKC